MNFKQLNAFYLVARQASFSRAAKKLSISQPAVSKHIRDLERFYGVRLFERSARKTILTESGHTLLSYAQRLFTLAQEAEVALESISGLKSGRIEIGTSRTVGTYYIPPIAVAFKQKYPGVTLSVHVENSQWVLDQIMAFELDLGILGIRPSYENLTVLPFAKEKLILAVPPGHPWAKRKAVKFSELQNQPLIIREKGSGTRRLIESEMVKLRVRLRVTMELGSNEAIKRAVEQGAGLALFPPSVAASEVRRGLLKTLRVHGAELALSFNVVYHRDKEPSPLVQAFLMVIEEKMTIAGGKELNRNSAHPGAKISRALSSLKRISVDRIAG